MVGENLDLSSEPDDGRDAGGRADGDQLERSGASAARPYLGVRFVCCDVYARIYINRDLTAYQGHCPKCSRPLVVRISPDGSDQRFFEAG
jgi:hypothetical protein